MNKCSYSYQMERLILLQLRRLLVVVQLNLVELKGILQLVGIQLLNQLRNLSHDFQLNFDKRRYLVHFQQHLKTQIVGMYRC